MSKNKTKIIAIFLILILFFSSTFVFADDETTSILSDPAVEAPETSVENTADTSAENTTDTSAENTTDTAPVQEDSYKKSDVYLAGDNVTVDYIVDGNLFVCADTVTINSQIGGDAFIIAKKLIIEEQGYIFSNLFTVSESIEIKGIVYDVYAVAQNLTISKGYVYRDLKVACSTLNVNGIVGRNAFVTCSTLNFNTDEETNGIIYGDLNYSANSEISIPENVVNGNVNYTHKNISTERSVQSIVADYILDLGSFLAFLLIIWLICLGLAPKFLNKTNDYVGKKSLGILGYGLVALVAIPIACIILIMLQLTAGFSFFLLALYILALAVSTSLFTITANNYVCSKMNITKNSGIFGMLILSGIVVWGISQIPYVGGVVSIITIVLGLGILVASILPKRTNKKEKTYDKTITEKSKKTDEK